MQIRFDHRPRRTTARLAALDAYMRTHVLTNRRFVCQHFDTCRQSHQNRCTRLGKPSAFYEGQLHHVGDCYDLRANGRDFRVIVVGQEYGHGPASQDRITRTDRIANSSGRIKRFVAASGHVARNQHMKGTTSVLRLLFGLGLGTDFEGEFIAVKGRRVHVFDAFALVNFLLCSAIHGDQDAHAEHARGGKQGTSTRTMQQNCAVHFRRALTILQPTVVILQGMSIARWVARGRVFDTVNPVTPQLSEATVGGWQMLVASFSHPSTKHWHLNWGTNDRTPYLLEVVRPTIAAVHDRLLGSRSPG